MTDAELSRLRQLWLDAPHLGVLRVEEMLVDDTEATFAAVRVVDDDTFIATTHRDQFDGAREESLAKLIVEVLTAFSPLLDEIDRLKGLLRDIADQAARQLDRPQGQL
jgi:hypothetical protein